MAKAIEALAQHQALLIITPPAERFIQGIAREQDFMAAEDFVKILDQKEFQAIIEKLPAGILPQVLNACLRNTFTPTVSKAGTKTNVIPGEAMCEIDCRLLPGTTAAEMVKTIETILTSKGCGDFIVEILHSSHASESPLETPLYRLFENSLKKHDPRAKLVPYMSSGATDSRFFRERGIVAYGMQMESSLSSMELMHGHNERIAIHNLTTGIKVMYDTVKEFCR
jgi:acetylornithine deacetylase/succinyl-diaminopimelate desuccinylase-like protein